MNLAVLQQAMHPALLALLAVVVVSLGAALLITGGLRMTKTAKKTTKKATSPIRKSDRSTAVSASLFKLKKSEKAQEQKQAE